MPLLFLAYDDFFCSAKLNEKYVCQNPSGKRVYANEAGGAFFSKSGSIAPIQQKSLFIARDILATFEMSQSAHLNDRCMSACGRSER